MRGLERGFHAGFVTFGMLVDYELIQRARGGDAAAFNQVVLAYRKRILGTIARLIGGKAPGELSKRQQRRLSTPRIEEP